MTRKLWTLAIPFFLITHGYAQTNSGTVAYQETIRFQRPQGVSGAEAEMLERMLPKEMKSEKILRYTSSASLYTVNKKAANQTGYQERNEGGMTVRVNVSGNGDEKCFTDLTTGKQTRQTEFMGRTFLVSSDRTIGWKMTGNQKVILGHACQEAVLERDSSKTVAWFASDIPVPAGPSTWSGLPGLVLEVEGDGGRFSLVATSVSSDEIAAVDLKIPTKGKKVTEGEFRRIVDERRREMGAQGNGTMIRVVREN